MKKKLFVLLMVLTMMMVLIPAFSADALADSNTVTITVANHTAFTQAEGAAWSGTLLDALSVPVSSGDTVLDVLEKALTETVNGVADYTSTGITTGYVTEINGLKACDATAAGKNAAGCAYYDGWCFAVNNVVPGVGMGSVYLEAGDTIRVEYSLDMTVLGAIWGSCDDATSGFAFSSGFFSYTTGTYGNTYTLTLPAATAIQVTAVPDPGSKTVRIYHNGTLSTGLNSDISVADGDQLQIVIGDYEKVYQVAVRTVGSISVSTLKTNIATAFADDTGSYWNIVAMMANNGGYTYTNNAKQAYLDTAIDQFVNPTSYSAVKLAMHIIAMTSLGYDVTEMIDGGNSYPAYDILKTQVAADTAYGGWAEVYAYSLMAYLQADSSLQASYTTEINTAIANLAAKPDGDWGYGPSADSAGITLAALCMAKNEGYPVDPTAIESAVTYLKSVVKAEGTVEDSFYHASNANSTAMAILGLDAAGEDVATITASGSTNSLFSGLLLYTLGNESGFAATSGALDASATQQGFLALAAASGSGATHVFDFGGKGTAVPETSTAYTSCPVIFSPIPADATVSVTKSGELTPQTAVIAGRFDLAAGEYSYSVSKTGYITKTGSFTVTADDVANHTRKTFRVSLASEPAIGNNITVMLYVKVPIDDAGTYTYQDNPAAYTDTVSQTLTLTAGCTVFDALDAALAAAGKTYVETTYGYIATIDGLSEFDQGNYSGWLYRVNGITPKISCRSYILTDDATVIWFYTDDYSNEYGSEDWAEDAATSSEATVTATLSQNTSTASATLSGSILTGFNKAIETGGDAKGAQATLAVTIPEGATALELTIPQSAMDSLGNTSNTSLGIETGFANLTFDPHSIDAICNAAGSKDIALSIAEADISAFSQETKALIGDRPVYDFSITAGDTHILDFGTGKVNIRIPYTPNANEEQNAIVVYYIDDAGTLRTVRGAYQAETGTVDFTVSHFSTYAVGYQKVTFADVAAAAWYYDAVTFCAARGITNGTDNHQFSPENTLTRGEFLVMLMRAYGLAPDQDPSNNFTDAGNTYYTNYLAAAKRLGLSNGIGNNQFAPDSEISRQDMFTLLYRALNSLGELPATATGKTLANYADAATVSDYAQTALATLIASGTITGSDGKLEPHNSATRAQMVQVLYRLLSR